LLFNKFRRPCDFYTHWAICPETEEPLLLIMMNKDIINEQVECSLTELTAARFSRGPATRMIRNKKPVTPKPLNEEE
jgi:hypothetical protein